jgi:hypothetical protein
MDRLAQLEQQAAAITAEIAAIKAGKTSPPLPPIDDRHGVRIIQLTEPSNFIRPTQKELRALPAAVVAKYPRLGQPKTLTGRNDDLEAEEYSAGFEWAFERLGNIRRANVPDTRHYVGHWVEECKEWLRLHRPAHRGNIGAGFLAAVVAHGDIPFTVGDEQRGIVGPLV